MDTANYENNDRKIESVYSTRIRAGKRRTYFFDVRATRANDYFLTITESRKRFDNNGYDRHKVFLYKEDFNKFLRALTEALDYVKTELMPDFDFDAFNHDEESGEEYVPNNAAVHEAGKEVATSVEEVVAPIVDSLPIVTEVVATASASVIDEVNEDHIVIEEKKPLEARDSHASQGDNLSNEEVDKW
jgi:hypothetical protein